MGNASGESGAPSASRRKSHRCSRAPARARDARTLLHLAEHAPPRTVHILVDSSQVWTDCSEQTPLPFELRGARYAALIATAGDVVFVGGHGVGQDARCAAAGTN